MLSNVLYDLCHLLSTPYNDINSNSNIINSLNNLLLEKIYLNKLLRYKHRKKYNSSFENIRFDYEYKILEQNSIFIKLKLNLKICFRIKNAPMNIKSSCISEYIIILEHLHDKFKIQFLIENEENPKLYNYYYTMHLSQLDSSDFDSLEIPCIYDPPLVDSFYNTSTLDLSEERSNTYFNISDACTYAETFALDPNPKYKYFGGIGGDCANFISQIVHAGGINKTNTWSPYTNAWIRVEDLYSYLLSQKLGFTLPNDSFLNRGCLIQFYTPSIGRYFHSGFITYKLPNNDCLYCCHSYNKLNYPLSEIYPNKYPKLRGLKFY